MMFRRYLVLIPLLTASLTASAEVLFAAPRGSADGSGERSQPLTLRAAFERAAENPSIAEIRLLEGTYTLADTVSVRGLVRPDSAVLTVRSDSGDRPAVLSGSQSLSGLWRQPASGDAVVARMPEAARAAVRVADLKAAGVSNLGTFRKRGFNLRASAPGELLLDGQREVIAGYPNPGDQKGKPSDPAGVEEGFQRYANANDRTVDFPRDVLKRWSQINDVWAHGYWGTDWADAHLKVASINASSGRITVSSKPSLGISGNGAIRVYNLPEELDTPGEYFVDRANHRIYYWPRGGGSLNRTAFSLNEDKLIEIEHSRNIRFLNVTFEASRGTLVGVTGSTGIEFTRCQFRGAGRNGIDLNGTGNRVESSHFEGIGDTAISVNGGDRLTLHPGANVVASNLIHNFGQIYLSYSGGVYLGGVGNVAAHNLIHDGPHLGIQVAGVLNRVFRNEVRDVCRYTDDAGAIYSGRDFTGWGNAIIENYVHRIETARAGRDWVHGLYLDDFASGFEVRRNIFENIQGYAIDSGGGRHVIIDGNVILNSGGGHLNDNRGAKWITTIPGDSWNMFERLAAVPRLSDPWKTAFPGLAKVPGNLSGAMNFVYPDGTEFTRNAGDAVSVWVKEKDWTSHNGGVFSHYAKFDGTRWSATVHAGSNLRGQTSRKDFQINKDGIVIPFSRIGLQDASWGTRRTSKSSALAAFTWNRDTTYEDMPVTFLANGWSPLHDPVDSYTWFIDGAVIGGGDRLHWIPDSGGVHRVELRVRTVNGASHKVESLIHISPAGARATAYQNKPQRVPGIVEVERFDTGRYHDTTSGNAGGAFRASDVDIGVHAGATYIGWTQPGEWFEITVDAAEGAYDLYVRAASRMDDMGIAFRWNGDLAGGIVLPNVRNNRYFDRHYVGRINVPTAGHHILRLDLLGKDFNIDHVELVRTGSAQQPPKPSMPTPDPNPEQPDPAPDTREGTLRVEYYDNIPGNTLDALFNDPAWPASPTSQTSAERFEITASRGTQYGVRVSGGLTPPTSGTYRFWLASDDQGSLRLGTSADPSSAREIASVSGHTLPDQFDKYASQRSAAIQLTAGQTYFIEAIMKQGWGGDHLSVQWEGPGISRQIIPANAFAPAEPDAPGAPAMGAAAFARFDGIMGKTLADLYGAAAFPGSPDNVSHESAFEYSGTGENFGLQAWAWLVPETSGDYTFWIASDDEGVLSLSNSSDSSAARVIATVPGHTASRQYDKYPSQRSTTVRLEAGRRYYIEALMKQGWGGSNLSVAWQGPGFSRQVIPGRVLGLQGGDFIKMTGTVNYAHFLNIPGRTLPDLYRTARFPDAPDHVEERDNFAFAGSGDNYGVFAWGWLVPEVSGDYTFWLASDDQGELLLSTGSDPASATTVAAVAGHSGHLQFDQHSSQKSARVRMEAGRAYYIAAAMKQAWGGSHLSVAWSGPGIPREVIPGNVLTSVRPSATGPSPAGSDYTRGSVAFARYDNIAGKTIEELRAASRFPTKPDSVVKNDTFDYPDDGEQFGVRAWAWIFPEVTGDYRFWIASDDNGELKLSKSDDPSIATLVASVSTHTLPGEYDKQASQRSSLIRLEAGRVYYIEATMKQGWGGSTLSVAWQGPGFSREVIPARVLGLRPGQNVPPVK